MMDATSWQYGGSLYRTRADMIIGMAADFVTAQGANNAADILAEHTDDDIADGIVAAGWLTCACDPDYLAEWDGDHLGGCMVGYGVDRADVLEAVAEYRASVEAEAARAAAEADNDG